jgi:hypothetical protein
MLWPTVWRRHAGSISYFRSCTAPCRGPLWSTATSAWSTSLPIPSNISTPSMLRSTSTSSVSASPLVMCVSYTSRRPPSSPTSSPRGCPRRCSLSFNPISTSVVLRVSTVCVWGGVRVFPILLGLMGCHVHSMGCNGLVFGEAQPQPPISLYPKP